MISRLTFGLAPAVACFSLVSSTACRSLTQRVFCRHVHALQHPPSASPSLIARTAPLRSFITVTPVGCTFHFPSDERMARYLEDYLMGENEEVLSALVRHFSSKKMKISEIQQGVKEVILAVFPETANDFLEDYRKMLTDLLQECAKNL